MKPAELHPLPSDAPVALLPPLFQRWADDLLGGTIPAETHATCAHCAMSDSTAATANGRLFNPNVKCCSFVPHLPNFAVGAILQQLPESSHGWQSVNERIASRIGVTPFGLDASEVYKLLYANSVSDAFGKSRVLRCPHYVDKDGGLCSIWQFRNSVCSTFHCKFVRGALGQQFWRRLHQLLAEVEHCLERWCALRLDLDIHTVGQLLKADFGPKPRERLTALAVDGEADLQLYRRLWGPQWYGHEHEYYVSAAHLVESLDWSDVKRIGGVTLNIYADLTRNAYDCLLSDRLPDPLTLNVVAMTPTRSGFVALRSYSADDQLVVPRQLAEMLTLFDGDTPTAAVIAETKRKGMALTPWIVRRLVDFAVLGPAT